MCIVLTGPIGPSIWAAALLPPVVAVWWQSSTRLGRVEWRGESEARKTVMLEAAPDAVIAIDNTGTIAEFNAAAETVFGRSRATAIGSCFGELLPDGKQLRSMARALSRGRAANVSGLRRFKLRAMRAMAPSFPQMLPITWMAASAGPIVTCFIRDLSRWEKAERALRESEARYRGLVEQAADAIFVLDAKGSVHDVNRVACESLGYSRAELVGRSSGKSMCGQWRHSSPGRTATLEAVHRRKDGTTFPVEVRLGTLSGNGHAFTLALARDVSDAAGPRPP